MGFRGEDSPSPGVIYRASDSQYLEVSRETRIVDPAQSDPVVQWGENVGAPKDPESSAQGVAELGGISKRISVAFVIYSVLFSYHISLASFFFMVSSVQQCLEKIPS